MSNSLIQCLSNLWQCARADDLPNWFALAFTAVLWPVALIVWQQRRTNGVAGLEVHFADGNITIDAKPFAAIDIQFTNHTGAVAYVSGVRIVGFTEAFRIPIEASRDRAENSYHLKFMNDNGDFCLREITLQTSTMAKTCMPTFDHLPTEFFAHAPSWFARKFRIRKYFLIQYTAMAGTTRHSVSTVY